MTTDSDITARELLRHALATLAYRAAKTVREAPASFGAYRAAEGTRSPAEILAHLGDLMEWADSAARGDGKWAPVPAATWDDDVARFFSALERLDGFLASDAPLGAPPDRLFQAPIADALTHVGQLALLRRAAGHPIRGESFWAAKIVTGRVGTEQTPARYEFD
jgi:hypothetical protein